MVDEQVDDLGEEGGLPEVDKLQDEGVVAPEEDGQDETDWEPPDGFHNAQARVVEGCREDGRGAVSAPASVVSIASQVIGVLMIHGLRGRKRQD